MRREGLTFDRHRRVNVITRLMNETRRKVLTEIAAPLDGSWDSPAMSMRPRPADARRMGARRHQEVEQDLSNPGSVLSGRSDRNFLIRALSPTSVASRVAAKLTRLRARTLKSDDNNTYRQRGGCHTLQQLVCFPAR